MKLLTEFVGTLLFLFVISLAATNGSVLAPLAIGGALCVMVYAGGHRSGGHYNPAVSFAFWLQKKLTAAEFGGYVLSQVVGGIIGFALGNYISGKTVAIEPSVGSTSIQALIVETIFTFALVLVVMNSAASRKTAGNSFYGLAIGLTIVVAAVAGGPISGGSFNPAVTIGATLIHASQSGGSWSQAWIAIVGPLVGGALASFVWAAQEKSEPAEA